MKLTITITMNPGEKQSKESVKRDLKSLIRDAQDHIEHVGLTFDKAEATTWDGSGVVMTLEGVPHFERDPQKAYWRCENCGYTWTTTKANTNKGSRPKKPGCCPSCEEEGEADQIIPDPEV